MYRVGKIPLWWIWGSLLFVLLSCSTTGRDTPASIINKKDAVTAFSIIHQEKRKVISGDLIMRTGRDFTSDIMRVLSHNDKTYSHGGIASVENDSLFVYHALGGQWNPDEKIRRDPFELFCNPYENKGFGIFRYPLNPEERTLFFAAARNFYAHEITFDMAFDLTSDDKMYCTEFVLKALSEVPGGPVRIDTTFRNNFSFIAPDNLFITKGCLPVSRIVFSSRY